MNNMNQRIIKEGTFAAQCTTCGLVRSVSDFYKQFRQPNPDDPRARCKQCESSYYKSKNASESSRKTRRNWKLDYNYGLSITERDALLVAQNGCCAICSQSFDVTKSCVDHCHTTSKVRVVLCDSCNQLLGQIQDDVQLLEGLLNYLLERG